MRRDSFIKIQNKIDQRVRKTFTAMKIPFKETLPQQYAALQKSSLRRVALPPPVSQHAQTRVETHRAPEEDEGLHRFFFQQRETSRFADNQNPYTKPI